MSVFRASVTLENFWVNAFWIFMFSPQIYLLQHISLIQLPELAVDDVEVLVGEEIRHLVDVVLVL